MRERCFPVGDGAPAPVDKAPGVELPTDRPSGGLGDSLPGKGVDDLVRGPDTRLLQENYYGCKQGVRYLLTTLFASVSTPARVHRRAAAGPQLKKTTDDFSID